MDDFEELLEGERPRAGSRVSVNSVAVLLMCVMCGHSVTLQHNQVTPHLFPALGSPCVTSREQGENASLLVKGLNISLCL